ncbi:MAG: type II secretion system F family protein [Clostridiales bacterium]|nr:type II secretion system F family protein [Clostridiales bacterium]
MADKEELKKYKYTAVDINNKKSTGILLAANEAELRKMLIETNLYLVSSKVLADNAVTFFSISSKVKVSEVTTFAREFAIMINAGIPIVDSLDTLRSQPYSGLFRRVLNIVHNDVRSGLLLSEAFAKHKKIFPELFISMTYVGEVSGSLDTILNELADYYERDNKIKRKAKSALVYPTILAILTLGVLVILVVFIIPTFKSTLEKLDVDMPPLTLAILNISDFFKENWKIVLLALLVFALIMILLFRLNKVKYAWDALKAKLPVIGNVTTSLIASRFARGFGTLIASGVDVVKSLEIMGDIIGNRYYQKKFLAAYQDIKEGHGIAEAFEAHEVFPKILIQMIAIGEKTGSLDSVIRRTTGYFDDRVETALTRMTSLLEPTIICIMGAIVAVIILSVFSPLLSIISTLGG